MRSYLLFFVAYALALSACREEERAAPTNAGIARMPHFELSADSSCLLAPNVFTPNSDGINDVFAVVSSNMATLSVEIRDPQNTIVFTSDDLSPSWDGTDSTGNGPYTVLVSGTTSSGVFLTGHSDLAALDYNGATCLTFNGAPVTVDQFDPRICGVTYTSNDIFCE